jgi:hypothetical protein
VKYRSLWILLLDIILIGFWAIIAVLKNKSGRPVTGPA